MNDMNQVIQPKTDQLNADSLLAGPITITIRDVKITPGTEQPVAVAYEGDDGKPWKPCKSTSRVMVSAWGPDAKAYVGRSLTLYRDPKVRWGGMEVGGIRISHMSHIDKDLLLVLTESQKTKKPVTIKPLRTDPKPQGISPTDWAAGIEHCIANLDPSITLEWWESAEAKVARRLLYAADKARHEALAERVKAFVADVEGA